MSTSLLNSGSRFSFHLLEINLISAQQLKPQTTIIMAKKKKKKKKNMKTYVVSWIDPNQKLKSRIDAVGGEHPTWNDKFVFLLDNKMLNSLSSVIVFEIYCVRNKKFFRDKLVGTVRVLLDNLRCCSNRYHEEGMKGTFRAFHVRLPSGDRQGILNIGINILDGFPYRVISQLLKIKSAIGYEKLTRETVRDGEGEEEEEEKGGGGGNSVKKGKGLFGCFFPIEIKRQEKIYQWPL